MASVPNSNIEGSGSPVVSDRLARKPLRNVTERVIETLLFLAACVSVLTTVGIVYVLVSESASFFANVSTLDFLTDTMWTPMFSNPRFGILPLLSATLVTSTVALLVAIPLGTIIAIYLSEFAKEKTREVVKPFLELLGGIPTIVYGHFALVALTPLLQYFFPQLPGFNMLSAGLIMGVAIIPYISSLAEDAMRAVPMSIREASYGMGATKFQTALGVVFPAALSGILSAYILGISRAVGETMIVAVAAGGQPNLTADPTEQGQTISAYIVQVALGDLPHGSIGYQSIFAAGLSLLVLTLFFNVVGHFIRRRYREEY
ncbi:MAG: phosphate ABC transporter permease subunit PstC [Limnobacter sp.]|nr:phosphate ABC transporter permease subunit PstC [Limnobacter sp.]